MKNVLSTQLLNYIFDPWVNADAFTFLIIFSGWFLLISVFVLLIFMKMKKIDPLKLVLLLLLPSAAIFLVINFYWYVALVFMVVIYIATYNEINGKEQWEKIWKKKVLLSIILTVLIPALLITIINHFWFKYLFFFEIRT